GSPLSFNRQSPIANPKSGGAEALLLVEVAQGADQLGQVAGDDGVELVEGQVDAVVGQAVLREVVGADALAAVAGADQRPPLPGLGHALHAVAAALVAEVLVDAVAGDAEDGLLEAALLAGAEGDVLDLPAHVAGVVGVHAVEVAGEQGGLVAAGAGPDLQDEAVEALAGVLQQEVFEPVLEGGAAGAQRGQLLLGQGARLGGGGTGEQGRGLPDRVAQRLH